MPERQYKIFHSITPKYNGVVVTHDYLAKWRTAPDTLAALERLQVGEYQHVYDRETGKHLVTFTYVGIK